jgi:molybdopterin-biosynthesis enzyme MoeA-like protein
MAMLFEGDTDPTTEGMVTVGRFESPIEAQMAKGMLESAGVECQLAGENVNSLLQAAFRVRLQVLEEDEAAARELMQQAAGDKEPDEDVEG